MGDAEAQETDSEESDDSEEKSDDWVVQWITIYGGLVEYSIVLKWCANVQEPEKTPLIWFGTAHAS